MEIEKPDMLIVDLMMPDIEGFEVIRRTRAMPGFGQTPILVISARTDQDAKERALSLGANGYMTKPLNLPQLIAEITRLVATA
ncbi:MAG: response regulator [Anaerolineae bacterium]|nr:response regulator [Anaerolineae bacterium]